jgi:CDP-glucose 4,6-dehydratase
LPQEVARVFKRVYADRNVLVTGHTGFKGSWLSAWLLALEARVSGLALDPNEDQRLFGDLGLGKRLASDHRVDIGDAGTVARVVEHVEPDFIFHLAAQPLVRQSYAEPAETFATNLMGTINLLEAVRRSGRNCVVVVVTTDKCYENREIDEGYVEDDRLGGRDPYSASKACVELAVAAYRQSYFTDPFAARVATVRAGNVIGGGDWSRDRIVPDAIRALRQRMPVPVRNPTATRPWQHVLEPLSGYLWLAVALERPDYFDRPDSNEQCTAFNFGPTEASDRTVEELVEELLSYVPGSWANAPEVDAPHEASKLQLSIDRARQELGWWPVWDFGETVRETAAWYLAQTAGKDLAKFTTEQIRRYEAAAGVAGVAWAK